MKMLRQSVPLILVLVLVSIFSISGVVAAENNPIPVDPQATPEAKELLEFLYDISGKHILSGQHDYPMSGPYFYNFAFATTGKYPALMGRDLGFSDPGTLDGINYRQHTVDDLIKAHNQGTIVTLMWHAVPPTMQEPVTFRGGIQSKITDEQWIQLTTPGTPLHERWKSQVDAIVPYLIQLQLAKVPVIWRPYHEMNGGWFWWGKKPGPDGYAKLYRMLFDRLVSFHGIHNLLWVFNANQVFGSVGPYADYYPGNDIIDILATDVYRTFESSDYEALLKLGGGKPIALGEVGPLPSAQYLREHPKWGWFMCWTEFLLKPERQFVRDLYELEQVLTLDELNSLKK